MIDVDYSFSLLKAYKVTNSSILSRPIMRFTIDI